MTAAFVWEKGARVRLLAPTPSLRGGLIARGAEGTLVYSRLGSWRVQFGNSDAIVFTQECELIAPAPPSTNSEVPSAVTAAPTREEETQ